MARNIIFWITLSLYAHVVLASPQCYDRGGWQTFRKFTFGNDLNSGYGISSLGGTTFGIDLTQASPAHWFNTQVSSTRVHSDEDLGISPNGKYLVTTTDIDLIVWDIASKKRLSFITFPRSTPRQDWHEEIKSVRFNPSSTLIAVEFLRATRYYPSKTWETVIYELPTLKKVFFKKEMKNVVLSDEPGVLFHTSGGQILKYDYANEKVLSAFTYPEAHRFFYFSRAADDHSVFFVSDKTVVLLSAQNLEVKAEVRIDLFGGFPDSIFETISMGLGNRILSSSDGRIYDLKSGQLSFRRPVKNYDPIKTKLSADGSMFAQIFDTGLVQVFNTSDWSLIREYCHVKILPDMEVKPNHSI